MDRETIWQALREVHDPEIPTLSILDLGIVAGVAVEEGRVAVDLMPTFASCPALHLIERLVEERLSALPGVEAVSVRRVYEPLWTVERLSEEARAKLAAFGVALEGEGLRCPFCGAGEVERLSPFGPTPCRSVYYCRSCHQPFEAMKAIRGRGIPGAAVSP